MLLQKRITWRLQAQGNLSERSGGRAEELAEDANLKLRDPREPIRSGFAGGKARTTEGRIPPSCEQRLLVLGTLLAREFRGRDVVVKVHDQGFEFEEMRYQSGSAITKEVTGCKWNGFLFYGIAGGGGHAGSGKTTSSKFISALLHGEPQEKKSTDGLQYPLIILENIGVKQMTEDLTTNLPTSITEIAKVNRKTAPTPRLSSSAPSVQHGQN